MKPKVLYLNTYKLVKGAGIPAFKQAVTRLIDENFKKCKGFISFKLLSQDNDWADVSEWETMEDYNAFLREAERNPSEAALSFYKFINFNTCKSRVYTVETEAYSVLMPGCE
jgi:heme-degrading monooxygenase HmoA